jgi:hypothetical protein
MPLPYKKAEGIYFLLNYFIDVLVLSLISVNDMGTGGNLCPYVF